MTLILAFIALVLLLSGNIQALLSVESNVFIEGEVMGTDANGKINTLNRINPLINSNVQLEKDLNELIYEPLIKVDPNGQPQSVLATFFVLEQGSRYQFKLKPNVFWQDGEPLTVDDVVATVNLIRSLEDNSLTSSLYSKTANKIDVIKSETDPDVFEFVVKNDQVIPGFFESISFKIMPAHLLSDINSNNITRSDPYINRIPVGTGPYKLASANEDTVELVKNENYWGNKPQIDKLRFKLFTSQDAAAQALATGQIHGLTNLNLETVNYMKTFNNMEVYTSNVIYNQYWAVYFNMGANGQAALKDQKVRQAIASAINRDEIVNALYNYAEVAHGTIPPNSFAFLASEKYTYNLSQAVALLDGAGYTPGEDGIRAKGEEKLSFELILVNDKDRLAVAQVIRDNLRQVGINVEITPKDYQSALADYLLPHNFDLMLYGVQTLIDPDRYELFVSTAIDPPGLNFSSYVSNEKRTQVVEGKTAKVPAVDDDLNDARRIIDETARKKKYYDFQKVIAEEVPVVFLFYPQEIYVVNKRVEGIELQNILNIEQRFDNITSWTISADNQGVAAKE